MRTSENIVVDERNRAVKPTQKPGRSRLWWWVGAAFAVQFAVWAVWLIFAAHHPVAEVPLAPEAIRSVAK